LLLKGASLLPIFLFVIQKNQIYRMDALRRWLYLKNDEVNNKINLGLLWAKNGLR
jgi:hypothetical protein